MEILGQPEALGAILENAPGFIAVVKGNAHTFTFANAAYRKFVCREDLIGKTVAEALPEIAAQGFVDILNSIFVSGLPYYGQDVRISVSRSLSAGQDLVRYCDFIYQPFIGANGEVTGIICEGYDTTQRHIYTEQVAELQRNVVYLSRLNAMGTMAATLAHELGQPLTAISNFAEAGRRHLAKGDQQSAFDAIHSISEITGRTAKLIRNLRSLTNRRSTDKGEFDLALAISECVGLVRAAGNPDVQITDHTPKAIAIRGDRIQIQQVLINLLKNASECGAPSSPIKVDIYTMVEPHAVRICVHDTGSGVSKQAERSLFTFTESEKEDGMGLGLSVSRTIVERHGGHLWLEHSDENGSVFCFRLPHS